MNLVDTRCTENGEPVLPRFLDDEESLWTTGLSLLAVDSAMAHVAANTLLGQDTVRMKIPADNKIDVAKYFKNDHWSAHRRIHGQWNHKGHGRNNVHCHIKARHGNNRFFA